MSIAVSMQLPASDDQSYEQGAVCFCDEIVVLGSGMTRGQEQPEVRGPPGPQ